MNKFNLVQVDVSFITDSELDLLIKKVVESGYKVKNNNYMLVTDVKHYFSIGKDSFFIGSMFPGRVVVSVEEFLAIDDPRVVQARKEPVVNIFEEDLTSVVEDVVAEDVSSSHSKDFVDEDLTRIIKHLIDYGARVGLNIKVKIK